MNISSIANSSQFSLHRGVQAISATRNNQPISHVSGCPGHVLVCWNQLAFVVFDACNKSIEHEEIRELLEFLFKSDDTGACSSLSLLACRLKSSLVACQITTTNLRVLTQSCEMIVWHWNTQFLQWQQVSTTAILSPDNILLSACFGPSILLLVKNSDKKFLAHVGLDGTPGRLDQVHAQARSLVGTYEQTILIGEPSWLVKSLLLLPISFDITKELLSIHPTTNQFLILQEANVFVLEKSSFSLLVNISLNGAVVEFMQAINHRIVCYTNSHALIFDLSSGSCINSILLSSPVAGLWSCSYGIAGYWNASDVLVIQQNSISSQALPSHILGLYGSSFERAAICSMLKQSSIYSRSSLDELKSVSFDSIEKLSATTQDPAIYNLISNSLPIKSSGPKSIDSRAFSALSIMVKPLVQPTGNFTHSNPLHIGFKNLCLLCALDPLLSDYMPISTDLAAIRLLGLVFPHRINDFIETMEATPTMASTILGVLPFSCPVSISKRFLLLAGRFPDAIELVVNDSIEEACQIAKQAPSDMLLQCIDIIIMHWLCTPSLDGWRLITQIIPPSFSVFIFFTQVERVIELGSPLIMSQLKPALNYFAQKMLDFDL